MRPESFQIVFFLLLQAVVGSQVAESSITSKELALSAKSKKQDALFTELDAESVGVHEFENHYSGPEVWTKRWREYILGTIGVGITLGDINGDRLPDLFVASKDEESKLYRNLGGMRFQEINDEAGFVDSSDPASGCTFVDIDNDGDLDLYLCFVGGENQLWINDGTGKFTEEAAEWGVNKSNGCTMASFADYDRDGDLDFYLQNNMLNDFDDFRKLEDQLFENRGDHFIEVTVPAGISGAAHGHSAVWWDYDEDGWPDIYVANDFEDPDKLYRNNGDGTFTDVLSQVSPQSPYYSMGADFGDIDNDGYSDFWVADMAATSREHHLRTVGNHEHVYKNTSDGETHQYLKNSLLLKLATNHFAEIAYLAGLAATDWTWAARLIDLNNDGRLDAFATNGMLRSFHDGDLSARQGAFQSQDWMTVVFRNEPIMKERNLVFENEGDLMFRDRSSEWGLDKLGVSFGVAFGDLDLDGDLDLVVNNFKDKLSVFQNNDISGNRITINLIGTDSNSYGVGAKVKVSAGSLIQVKELALMRGYMSGDQPILHFGLSESERVDCLEVWWPSGNYQRFEALASNKHYEIVETANENVEMSTANVTPLFEKAEFKFPATATRKEAYYSDFRKQPLLPFPESRFSGPMKLADLNKDGLNDLVLGGASGQETLVLINQGKRSFGELLSLDFEDDFGSEDTAIELVDFDGDQDLDLLVSSGGVEMEEGDLFYQDRIYLNEGNGEFKREWNAFSAEVITGSSTAAWGDFDGDGDVDGFFGGGTIPNKYPYTYSSSLWRNDDGLLTRVDDDVAAGLADIMRVTSATWVDIDNDDDLDLLISIEWGSPQLWKNEGGVLVRCDSFIGTAEMSGLWSALAVDDLDGDGRPDIVLGNWGLNSEYKATEDEPKRLWYSSKSDPNVKLIETYLVDGMEWTREVRKRLAEVYPREMRKYRTYEEFAGKTFQHMFPNLESEGYRYSEVNQLMTGILWQTPTGGFFFEPLPSLAQSGRVMDILIEDFDRDGDNDILLALELPSPEPWTGRFEKGHLSLFLNKGENYFESVKPWDSGLIIDGSPREMVWGDLDSDKSPELIVRLSEGDPLVFSLSAKKHE